MIIGFSFLLLIVVTSKPCQIYQNSWILDPTYLPLSDSNNIYTLKLRNYRESQLSAFKNWANTYDYPLDQGANLSTKDYCHVQRNHPIDGDTLESYIDNAKETGSTDLLRLREFLPNTITGESFHKNYYVMYDFEMTTTPDTGTPTTKYNWLEFKLVYFDIEAESDNYFNTITTSSLKRKYAKNGSTITITDHELLASSSYISTNIIKLLLSDSTFFHNIYQDDIPNFSVLT